MYEKIGSCAALLLVGYLSAWDIRTRKLPALPLLLFGALAVLYVAAGGRAAPLYFAGCMLPGMALLLLSVLTGERIGYGDGAVLLVIGLWVGSIFCTIAACISIFLTGLYAVCLLLTGRRGECIPFMPYLLAAMEVILLYE